MCSTLLGVVAEPRDSWLEAYSGEEGVMAHMGKGAQRARRSVKPLLALADLFPPTWGP